MANTLPCRHCGHEVEPDDMVCPSCGGEHPHPAPEQAGSGVVEKGCIVLFIVGGLVGGIAIIVAKLVVGW